jgi:hypothetical protein
MNKALPSPVADRVDFNSEESSLGWAVRSVVTTGDKAFIAIYRASCITWDQTVQGELVTLLEDDQADLTSLAIAINRHVAIRSWL